MQLYLGYLHAIEQWRYWSHPDGYLVIPDDISLPDRSYCTLRCYVPPGCAFRAVRLTVPAVELMDDLCLRGGMLDRV